MTWGSSPHTRGAPGCRGSSSSDSRIIPAYAGSTVKPLRSGLRHTDHPRIRGEHFLITSAKSPTVGSSPHTRGALPDNVGQVADGRIIPAYAGSTTVRSISLISRRDHPRIRGEHADYLKEGQNSGGSSPHTRGARVFAGPAAPGAGIIPAYAGSTPSLSGWPTGSPDHPRIRGEHSCTTTKSSHALGIIPAYAGSTVPVSVTPVSRWDHPRIRGEHGGVDYRSAEAWGSSPHTRGAHFSPIHGARAARIIPAYAGSTGWRRRRGRSGRDHPRIRGEHVPIALIATALAGSSPHTRGARWRRTGRRPRRCGSSPHTRGAPAAPATTGGRCGIIPAYAGSTSSAALGWLSVGDHPRIRGEHIKSGFGAIKDGGSSPHTRGAQCRGWRS